MKRIPITDEMRGIIESDDIYNLWYYMGAGWVRDEQEFSEAEIRELIAAGGFCKDIKLIVTHNGKIIEAWET